ncbi:hypothetical protein KFK09_010643 [Dendrobium nobile]|uniref:LOB domain-containing protein n=1 Tax=Dendrobium nobile TaxID=94219 RepID=A0A8T3BCB9_DENNO|nr:hypothetical protein KFK09_010643 [Dendrobium nobile]
MKGLSSPCGACKFLRRKCVRGCVFAPCFCHEQGASHFAAIHKVFGASNFSKLLMKLPIIDRCKAASTIFYEAQARLQDPIFGCVSHIFALQQQVVSLQAQLASLRAQAAQAELDHNTASVKASTAPDAENYNSFAVIQSEYWNGLTFDPTNLVDVNQSSFSNPMMNFEPFEFTDSNLNYFTQSFQDEFISLSVEEQSPSATRQIYHDMEDLQSVVLPNLQRS